MNRIEFTRAAALIAFAGATSCQAYLGGFEPADGYTIGSIGNLSGPYLEPMFSGSSGPELIRYNAGTPSPATLTPYAATSPSITSDPRRWNDPSTSQTGWFGVYGEGAARDRTYVNAHYIPSALANPLYGSQGIAFRSGDLDVNSSLPVAPTGGSSVTYRLDSLDLGGFQNTAADLANSRIDFSFAINYAGWVTQFPTATLPANPASQQYQLSSVDNDASLMEIDLGGRPLAGSDYASIQGTYGVRLRFYDNQRIDLVHGNGSGGETVSRFQDAQGDLRANWRGWTVIQGFLDLSTDTFSVEVATTAAPTPSILTAVGPYNNAGTSVITGSLRNALDSFGNITMTGREDPDGGGVFKNYLDNFSFSATTLVPEPSTYATVVGALGLLAAFLRRTRRT